MPATRNFLIPSRSALQSQPVRNILISIPLASVTLHLSRSLKAFPPYLHYSRSLCKLHTDSSKILILLSRGSGCYKRVVPSVNWSLKNPSPLLPRPVPLQTRSSSFLSPPQLCSQPRQSGLRNLSVAIVIAILSGTVLFRAFYPNSDEVLLENSANLPYLRSSSTNLVSEEEQEWSIMTGEILRGRPGNLTSEEEEKLREIWAATLQVFGVLSAHHVNEVNGSNQTTPSIGTHPISENLPSEKQKKKKRSLFGRKKRDSDSESTLSNDPTSPGPPSDSEDKYGQTKQFHDTLAHQTPESLRAAFWSMVKHDHPDALLLRFLRARKWDVEKALIMMVSTMNWRATEMHVDDDIMKLGEEGALTASNSSNLTTKKSGEDFLAQMRMGKSFLHGTDKSGRPMCFVRVRLHKQGEQSEESLERYTVFVIESARMILAPPVDTACVIFDMTGFSLANMDYSPVKFMIKCFEANYPESLGVVLVHKAPWVFQGIWKIIRGWLDPVVASKVHFTNSVDEMEEFVSRNHIIKELGGDEDWSYTYVEPIPNENEKMKDIETRDHLLAGREKIVLEYESATLNWIDNPSGPELAVIMDLRHRLAAILKEDYWRLDPFIRARSLYDRFGMVQAGGRIRFYPADVVISPPVANGVAEGETSPDDVD